DFALSFGRRISPVRVATTCGIMKTEGEGQPPDVQPSEEAAQKQAGLVILIGIAGLFVVIVFPFLAMFMMIMTGNFAP
ncbi:hypothetical protein, partial [Mesorhizobium sp. B1-1-5]|uniref:hypothetical protein n=1 Tax=Mesorhizobium sp. B1-1-5 TaxID=2589979 RepID=UPI001AEE05CB